MPSYSGFAQPNPAPAPPGDPFAPPMSGNPQANTPTCAEWTRNAGPDESMVITGSNLSNYSGKDEGKDTRFRVVAANGTTADANIQRLDGDKAIITLPKTLPPWAMYLIWPANETGYGTPIAVNKTDAWWVGPDKAARGTTISVYGRNLAQNNGTTTSNIYIKPASGAGQWVAPSSVNPYRVSFTVPAGLATGDYEVWVHNGHGAQYGWSGPLKLTVDADRVVNASQFNVKNYGAKGDGSTDDTQSIINAIRAATAGSTVYFPSGTYMVSNTISLKSNIKFQGENKNNTIIKCSNSFSASALSMLYGNTLSNYQIENFTLDGNSSYRGTLSYPVWLRGSANLQVNEVNFSFHGYTPLDLHLSKYVFLTNCEIVGKYTFLGNCSQLFIDRCQFKMTNDTELAMHTWGGVGISLTNTTCQDLNNSNPNDGAGWGLGRFFVGNGAWGGSTATYIAQNNTIDLAPRPTGVDQNTGEQFMWEGLTTDWAGTVGSSTPLTTSLNGLAGNIANPEYLRYAVIVKGKGLGQSRRIVSYNGSTVTLESAWNVMPDAQSWITIGRYADRIVLYKNTLDGKQAAVTTDAHVASAGIEPYGGVSNFIADNNTIQETRFGIANWATEHSIGIDPNYFSFYANNKLLNCRWGLHNALIINPADIGTGLLGTTYRNNDINNALQSGILTSVSGSGMAICNSLIFESNKITGALNGFSTDGGVVLVNNSTTGNEIENQLFYKNSFTGSTGYGIKITPKVALRENTFSGFPTTYNGSLLVLEGPNRVIDMDGQADEGLTHSSLTIWNSGVKAMGWTASSNASWLLLSATSGSIPDQKATTTIDLSANPDVLPTGIYKATVTVTAGDQTKAYLIVYKVINTKTIAFLDTYPNPFQKKITIEFATPENTEAILQVFNLQGILLETLYDGPVKNETTHQYEFDGIKYASGIYICKLTCGKTVLSKRLILIK